MLLEILHNIIIHWPQVGLVTFLIFTTLLSITLGIRIPLNQQTMFMLLTYIVIGPISIPISCHILKGLK